MDFTEKLRLRGKAEEDRFFAELDRQLIEAMHDKQKRDNDMSPAEEPENPNFQEK
ncbi:hypothetical protein [Vibrio alfacsensis]|uniref:hypothetical protein n=1 Tax=Vibrio alfacsensis TaxID=1074311 RepID=UPI004068558C